LKITIATRQSALALWQAEHVAARLRELGAVSKVDLLPLSTRGDEILDRSLLEVGGKGLFIKELEVAMLEGRADIAVHSMKDVPAEMPDGFCLAAVLQRANPFDALVTPAGLSLDDLPQEALVGSSSLRRQAQLLAARPDLRVRPLRGNVNTRLAKLDEGHYDAIVLACAGLERLGFADRIGHVLPPERMLPAAAQGVVGIECRDERPDLKDVLLNLQDPSAKLTTLAERAVARRLEASCHSPLASYARLHGDELSLTSLVAKPDGSKVLRRSIRGPSDTAEALGLELADQMLRLGAADMLVAENA